MPSSGASFRAFVRCFGFCSRSTSSALCSYIGSLTSASCMMLSHSHLRGCGLLCLLLCTFARASRVADLCRSCCLQLCVLHSMGFRYACVANRIIKVFLPRRIYISCPVHVMIGKCLSLPVFGFLVISCRALRAADLHASFMLVSGTTATQELCVTIESGVLTVGSYCQIVFAACVCWKVSLL
jgi:hypothetical protein